MRSRDLLFSKYDLRASLEATERTLKADVDAYGPEALLNANVEDLVQYFVESAELSPIRLLEEQIEADTAETQIDVSHRFEYGGFDDEQIVVPGTIVTLHVPFEGDPQLFGCVASTRSFNPPRGTVTGRELVLSFRGTEGDMARAKQELEAELAKVREHIAWIENDVVAFNGRLPAVAHAAVG